VGNDSGPPADSGSGVTCPLAGADASPGSCEVSTPCSDGNVYRIDCNTQTSACTCWKNGTSVGPTVVNGDCSTGWANCGFPPFSAVN
jgi:hypothetical protein